MMNRKLIDVLASVFDVPHNQINTDLSKEDVGNWDSLRQMDLVISIEHEFEVVLEMQDIARMDSFKNIKRVLVSKGIDFGD